MKGKFLVLLLLSIICTSFFLTFAHAEQASFNFGTTQPLSKLTVEPGKTSSTKIYFYNLWGNRVTHVTLSVVEKSPQIDVKIIPALGNVTLNVTGVVIDTQENLFAVPCSLDSKWCPTNDTFSVEGADWIELGSIDGKVPAKYAIIEISAPSDTPLWKDYSFKISANARWYGEAGMVALTQEREFSYTVKTVTQEYSESIIEGGKENKNILNKTWPYLITILILLVIILLARRIKKKRI